MSKAAPPKPPDEDAKRNGAKADGSRVGGRKRKVDGAFDVWLQRGLHELYDNVAREPIPDELLRLIEADRKK